MPLRSVRFKSIMIGNRIYVQNATPGLSFLPHLPKCDSVVLPDSLRIFLQGLISRAGTYLDNQKAPLETYS
jgi:hypothetical protein